LLSYWLIVSYLIMYVTIGNCHFFKRVFVLVSILGQNDISKRFCIFGIIGCHSVPLRLTSMHRTYSSTVPILRTARVSGFYKTRQHLLVNSAALLASLKKYLTFLYLYLYLLIYYYYYHEYDEYDEYSNSKYK